MKFKKKRKKDEIPGVKKKQRLSQLAPNLEQI